MRDGRKLVPPGADDIHDAVRGIGEIKFLILAYFLAL